MINFHVLLVMPLVDIAQEVTVLGPIAFDVRNPVQASKSFHKGTSFSMR